MSPRTMSPQTMSPLCVLTFMLCSALDRVLRVFCVLDAVVFSTRSTRAAWLDVQGNQGEWATYLEHRQSTTHCL